jgi:hypothetical protein
VAGGSALPRLLDGIAAACYALQYRCLARRLLIALAALSIGLLLFARPDELERRSVPHVALHELSAAYAGRFVRVSGTVLPLDDHHARQYQPGSAELWPLFSEDKTQVVWLMSDNAKDLFGNYTTLTAQVTLGHGDQQPAWYLRAGLPPNVLLAHWLNQCGRVMLVILLVVGAALWLMRRLDYAIPMPWPASRGSDAPPLLWFGGLGRPYGDHVVRSRPVQLSLLPHEARLESPDGWTVTVRRLRRAHLFDVATRHGSLPALRLHFDDECGLQRRGVLAADSPDARQALIQMLSLIR